MQCWCEPEKQYTPSVCAEDGDDCMCNGVVFYMKKMQTPIRSTDFYSALMSAAYTLQQANNTRHVQCTKSTFEDVNPLPGEDKLCWCDEQGRIMTSEQQY